MREIYGAYTLVTFSGCCGSGGVGIEDADGQELHYPTPEGDTDLHLFPTDREAREWIDAGAALADDFVWAR
ncbi:MAG: hypothetical protein KY468_07860 [Armatimonadetes bacterium]|nr:hypothetical protein [Armatimonadota bacterium]